MTRGAFFDTNVPLYLLCDDLAKAGRAEDLLAEALGAHLLKHGFAKWQLPDRYEVIDAVPRTSTGKFWKLKLRERFPC